MKPMADTDYQLEHYDPNAWTPQGAYAPVGAGGFPVFRHLKGDDDQCIEEGCENARWRLNETQGYRRCKPFQYQRQKTLRAKKEMKEARRRRLKKEPETLARKLQYQNKKRRNERRQCKTQGCSNKRTGNRGQCKKCNAKYQRERREQKKRECSKAGCSEPCMARRTVCKKHWNRRVCQKCFNAYQKQRYWARQHNPL